MNGSAHNLILLVEVDGEELAEPGRVVVPGCFSIAHSLHQWRGRYDRVLDLSCACRTTDRSEVVEDMLGADGLSGAGFTRRNDGLISTLP